MSARLIEGLGILSLALQNGQRQLAQEEGLTVAQAAIIAQLASRKNSSMRVKDLAIELGVSQPTTTDSLNALVTKKLVKKEVDPADARATLLRLTARGERLAKDKPLQTSNILSALGSLGPGAENELMVLVTATIKALQASGAIAPQRQCISCKHFRPYVHEEVHAPHHCAFVDAAFGNAALRFQCGDHQTAALQDQSANWSVFAEASQLL